MEKKDGISNPRLRANFLSRYVHSWIFELLKKSRKKTIDLDDLYVLMPEFKAEDLADKLEQEWNKEMRKNPTKPSLIWATIRTMGWTPFLVGFLLIPKGIATILQTILIIILMDFFAPCPKYSSISSYGIASALVICSLCTSCCYHPYYYTMQMYGLKMRSAYIGLIYRKILRLSKCSMNLQGSGQMNTLISSDAEQIDMVGHFFHYLWIAPLELFAVAFLFWYFVRYISLIAVAYTIIIIMSQMVFGELFVLFRTKILKLTDERMKLMSEVLRSMRVIKMYSWESPFEKKIISVRHREIIQCAYRLLLDCVQTLFSHTHLAVTLLFMYMVMWFLHIRFDIRLFAIFACLIGYMRMWTIDTFNYAVRNLVHYLAARKRIEKFLLLAESEHESRIKSHPHQTQTLSCQVNSASWDKEKKFTLKDIAFNASPGDLICIVGEVGSGKTSLLQALLGEITHFDGCIERPCNVCYVPQEAWLFSSTVKENIVLGAEYDHQLFHTVLRASSLEKDVQYMKNGINTLVGDQGAALSGGQKARINLARALYRNGDVYLLDDPLSAVDVHVGGEIFDNAIKTYLRNKICILVTHQIRFIERSSQILVLKNGTIQEKGSYEELKTKDSFQALIANIIQHQDKGLDDLVDADEPSESKIYKDDTNETVPMIQQDARQEGIVKASVYINFIRAGIGIVGGILLVLIFCVYQGLGMFSNWWLAIWSESEGQRYGIGYECRNETILLQNNTWKNMSETKWKHYRDSRFYIYAGLTSVFILLSIIRVMTTEFMCLNAGRVLHNRMLRRILRCPISFFDKTAIGQVLNRFSKDVVAIDDTVPLILFEFLQTFFQIIGAMVLAAWFNPWSLLTTTMAIIALIFVRQHLAPCSLDLKRLESATRSPLYSYLTSSFQGAQIIRSFQVQTVCSKIFLTHLDTNTSVNYLMCTINRWAAFRFDWVTAFFIACVTILSIITHTVRGQLTPVDIALTLFYSLNLMGLLQWSIRLSVETETLMTGAERIFEYHALNQEPIVLESTRDKTDADDGSLAKIEFQDVSVSYSSDKESPLILNDVSLRIYGSEKIGIVGRTGAGKSTMLLALFRLNYLVKGRIFIDNIDINTIPLKQLRDQISAIPQDPVLFTDTLRANLDPFGYNSDAKIWQTLEMAQLSNTVKDRMPNGLHSFITEGGSNLSVGEKQLICLARAMLKNSKILVMDEATAGVDIETAHKIQSIIRDRFRDCTVLTIAHRLETVRDSDRVLVLDGGSVKEFDTPDNLLNNPESQFSRLIFESENRVSHRSP